jgi:hypothetical protein
MHRRQCEAALTAFERFEELECRRGRTFLVAELHAYVGGAREGREELLGVTRACARGERLFGVCEGLRVHVAG